MFITYKLCYIHLSVIAIVMVVFITFCDIDRGLFTFSLSLWVSHTALFSQFSSEVYGTVAGKVYVLQQLK